MTAVDRCLPLLTVARRFQNEANSIGREDGGLRIENAGACALFSILDPLFSRASSLRRDLFWPARIEGDFDFAGLGAAWEFSQVVGERQHVLGAAA